MDGTHVQFWWTCLERSRKVHSKYQLKQLSKKLNMSSKEFIWIEIEIFDDFIKMHVELKGTQEQGHFEFWNVSWSNYKISYTKTSNNIRSVYLGILLYMCQNHRISTIGIRSL